MKKIFVVDDDQATRALIEHILSGEGYEVKSFENTSKFLNKLQRELPDLVILDVKLPDGDGRQVCRILKRTTETSHIPVIIISIYTTQEDILKDELADGFLEKPFLGEDLKYIVKKAF